MKETFLSLTRGSCEKQTSTVTYFLPKSMRGTGPLWLFLSSTQWRSHPTQYGKKKEKEACKQEAGAVELPACIRWKMFINSHTTSQEVQTNLPAVEKFFWSLKAFRSQYQHKTSILSLHTQKLWSKMTSNSVYFSIKTIHLVIGLKSANTEVTL